MLTKASFNLIKNIEKTVIQWNIIIIIMFLF